MGLPVKHARLISTTNKTKPHFTAASPRWILKLLPYVQVSSGVYHVNRVGADPGLLGGHFEGSELPGGFAGYHDTPKEYTLSTIEGVLNMHSRIMDVYNDPYNQLQEQLSIYIQSMKELQEFHVFNDKDFGLLHVVEEGMSVETETGPPTPNDMDNLIAKVWKQPAFFVAHPRTIARFGQECTARGVCIGAVEMLGSPFQTWRGIPIVPSDKIPVNENGETSILLMRVGAENNGVVGLQQSGIKNEVLPSTTVRLKGIDSTGVASYLITLYHSVAVHAHDAVAILKNVQI